MCSRSNWEIKVIRGMYTLLFSRWFQNFTYYLHQVWHVSLVETFGKVSVCGSWTIFWSPFPQQSQPKDRTVVCIHSSQTIIVHWTKLVHAGVLASFPGSSYLLFFFSLACAEKPGNEATEISQQLDLALYGLHIFNFSFTCAQVAISYSYITPRGDVSDLQSWAWGWVTVIRYIPTRCDVTGLYPIGYYGLRHTAARLLLVTAFVSYWHTGIW